MLEPVAMGPDEFEDTAAEFARSVQIVSRLPDHVMSQDIEDSFFKDARRARVEIAPWWPKTAAD